MLGVLQYDESFDKVLRNVFAKAMICRTMGTCTALAKQHRLDCVTLEGAY